jgi:hypothetical protein
MSTPAWLARRLTTPCTIFNRIEAGADEHGNVIYAELSVDTLCFIQPAAQQEIQDGRAEVGQYLVHLPAAMAGQLDGFARVQVGLVSYEAAAPPALYPSLDGRLHHIEIAVERSTA